MERCGLMDTPRTTPLKKTGTRRSLAPSWAVSCSSPLSRPFLRFCGWRRPTTTRRGSIAVRNPGLRVSRRGRRPRREAGPAADSVGSTAWHAAGHRGRGIKVAILDSGFCGYQAHLGKASRKR